MVDKIQTMEEESESNLKVLAQFKKDLDEVSENLEIVLEREKKESDNIELKQAELNQSKIDVEYFERVVADTLKQTDQLSKHNLQLVDDLQNSRINLDKMESEKVAAMVRLETLIEKSSKQDSQINEVLHAREDYSKNINPL